MASKKELVNQCVAEVKFYWNKLTQKYSEEIVYKAVNEKMRLVRESKKNKNEK